ncbi:hypothetical protein IGK47_000331 [Enterococcus sp. AZ007]
MFKRPFYLDQIIKFIDEIKIEYIVDWLLKGEENS